MPSDNRRPEGFDVEIREMGPEALAEYAAIPTAYTVESVLRVESVDKGLGGFRLVEEKVTPYRKDYDDHDHGDENPLSWAGQFDISSWGIFMAFEGSTPVGGATVAVDAAVMEWLGDCKDVAVLWDIRVRPEHRGCGIGSGLFQHAADWARSRGYKQLKLDTQDVNVPACRFYVKQGCELGGIVRDAFTDCPAIAHEVMLLWYLAL